MSDSSCGDKTCDSVSCRYQSVAPSLMPNIRKVKVTGSDLLRCSSNAPEDQTSGSNVTLDPKHQTSSDVGLSFVNPKKRYKRGRRGGSNYPKTKEEDESDEIDAKGKKQKGKCIECKKELPLQVVYQTSVNSKKKRKKAILPSHVLNFNNMVLCPNCITNLPQ